MNQIKDIKAAIDGKIMEFTANYYYLQFNEANNTIEAGAACNAGLIPIHKIDYDFDLSVDDNLQRIYEVLEAAQPKQVIFTECEPDGILTDWYFEDDALYGKDAKNGIIITGNKCYKEFFYVSDEVESEFKEDFNLHGMDKKYLIELLTRLTEKKYDVITIRGYSQSDWNYLFYPVDDFTQDYLREIEAYYFGMVSEWYNEADCDNITIPHYERDEKTYIRQCYNYDSDTEIILKRITGYKRIPTYTEE